MQCWLKKQKDVMAPAVIARGEDVMWTSGLVFGKGEGILGLETNLGTLHIQVSVLCLYMLKRGKTCQCVFCMLFGLLSFSFEDIRWGY